MFDNQLKIKFYPVIRKCLPFLAILIVLSLISSTAKSQDLHYSQFYYSPQNLNPALAGIFNGDLRFQGNYRNQWTSVPVDYTTFTGAFDTRINPSKNSDNFVNLGAVFNFDRAGDLDFGLAQLGINAGYTFAINKNNLFTPAMQVTVQQRRFSFDEARFVAVNEPTATSGTDFDLAAGINYRNQRDERTKFDFGASLSHLLRPDKSFNTVQEERRDLRLSAYGIGSMEVSDRTDLMLRGLGQFQGENELLLGAALKFYISKKRGSEIAFEGGGTYRFGDAIFPNFTIYYNGMRLGFSYDVNVSAFDRATASRGGPELAFSYIVKRVKPLRQFKNCPIF